MPYLISKRNNHNSTHLNYTDHRIKLVTPFKQSHTSKNIETILIIITFGIFLLLKYKFTYLYIRIFLIELSSIKTSTLISILDIDNNISLLNPIVDNFLKHSKHLTHFLPEGKYLSFKEKIDKSVYKGNEMNNRHNESYYFKYNNAKYVFIEETQTFEPLHFDLNKYTNKEIHSHFKGGIKSIIEYNYLLNKFDLNINDNNYNHLLQYFMRLLFRPLNIYQFIICILLFIIGNTISPIVTIIFILMTVVYELYIIKVIINNKEINNNHLEIFSIVKRNLKSDSNFNDSNHKVNILNSDSKYIVPGDIVILRKNTILNCDVLLLTGVCNVNESELNGDSNIQPKLPLYSNDDDFSYENSKSSILYCGCQVISVEPNENNEVLGLVINTNINTYKSNLSQVFINKKEGLLYLLYIDYIIYFSFLFFILIIFYILCYIIYNPINNPYTYDFYMTIIKDTFNFIIPSALPICINYSKIFLYMNLIKKDIKCLNSNKINIAGKVNRIIFDKTGTLSHNTLNLIGYQSSFINYKSFNPTNQFNLDSNDYFKNDINDSSPNHKVEEVNSSDDSKCKRSNVNSQNSDNYYEISEKEKKESLNSSESKKEINNDEDNNEFILGELETSVKVYVNIHKYFWKKYFLLNNNNREDLINDKNYNVVFFIECLSTCNLLTITNGSITGSYIDKIIYDDLNWELEEEDNEYIIIPPYSYTITDSKDDYHKLQFKLIVKFRHSFSDKYEFTIVIVYNTISNKYAFYLKGDYEKIIDLCIKEKMKIDMDNFKNEGKRIIVCAFRWMTDIEEQEFFEIFYEKERIEFIKGIIVQSKERNDFTFLGYCLFNNPLKSESKYIIKKLNDNYIKINMCTGDNSYTSFNVARDCDILTKNTFTYIIDLIEEDGMNVLTCCSSNCLNKINFLLLIDNKLENNINKSEIENSYRRLLKTSIFHENNSHNKINIFNFPKELINYNNKNQIKTFKFAISGEALMYIIHELEINLNLFLKENKKISNRYNSKLVIDFITFIINNSAIFFNMSYENKISLVKLYKRFTNELICYVGDSSNDFGAITCSHLGILLNKDSYKGEFFTVNKNLNNIEIILNTGRALLENNSILFKYFIIYTITMLSSYILLKNESFLTYNQILFIEIFVILILSLLSTSSSAQQKFLSSKSNKLMIDFKFLFSLLGILVLNISFLSFVFKIIPDNNLFNINKVYDSDSDSKLKLKQDSLFLFISIQLPFTFIILNHQSQNRKEIFLNKTFMFYFSFLLMFIFGLFLNETFQFQSLLITNMLHISDIGFQYYLRLFKLIIIFSLLINLNLIFIYEKFINWYFTISFKVDNTRKTVRASILKNYNK